MNFSCDNCQRRYQISDEKVLGKTVKIRCKQCQAIITVKGPQPQQAQPEEEEDRTRVASLDSAGRLIGAAGAPAADPWNDEPTRAAPPLDLKAQWFAMLGGKQEGPLHGRNLMDRLASGDITLKTFLWKDGMGEWKRAEDLPEFAAILGGESSAAPPPVAAPSVAPVTIAPVRASPFDADERTSVGGGGRASSQPWDTAPQASSYDLDPAASDQPAESEDAEQPTAEQHQAEQHEEQPEADQQAAGEPESEPEREAEPEPRPEPPRRARGGARKEPAQDEAQLDNNQLFNDLDLGAHAKAGSEALAPQSVPETGRTRRRVTGEVALPTAATAPDTSGARSQVREGRRGGFGKGVAILMVLIAVAVGALYVLSEMKVVPLEVTTEYDASGNAVKQSVFTAAGAAGLKDLVLGNRPPQAAAPPQTATAPQPTAPATAAPAATAPPAPGSAAPSPLDPKAAAQNQQLAGHPEGAVKPDVVPAARSQAPSPAAASEGEGGPSQADVAKVIAQTNPAFQGCIEQELKKNPHFKGGKINLVASVDSSGAVKQVTIDKKDVDGSPLGQCLKSRAKRMTFAPFQGDDVDLEIPLILSRTL